MHKNLQCLFCIADCLYTLGNAISYVAALYGSLATGEVHLEYSRKNERCAIWCRWISTKSGKKISVFEFASKQNKKTLLLI